MNTGISYPGREGIFPLASEQDEYGEEKQSKILETETVHYEPEGSGNLGFDSGIVVGGFPTSIELDPTTQVAESLQSEGVEAALIALYPGEAEVIDPDRGAVYNTPTEGIFQELNQRVSSLPGYTAVFGYCAGGVYALESGLMERDDTAVFIGSDVPEGMENYEGIMEPETDGLVFYDEKMDGRVDARHLDVHGTDHIWQDTPEDYGEAQVRAADIFAGETDPGDMERLAETYEWLETSRDYKKGEKVDATGL